MTDPGPALVCWVGNHDDARSTVRYLAQVALGGPSWTQDEYRPVVLRPTPGSVDETSIALDLLIAVGKNPERCCAPSSCAARAPGTPPGRG